MEDDSSHLPNNNQSHLSNSSTSFNNNNTNTKTSPNDFTLSDLNNYSSSNRLLIINDTFEFWINDIIVTHKSNFFYKLFTSKTKHPTKEESIPIQTNTNTQSLMKTYIDVPHSEYFFDILTWIYSNDPNRLTAIADEPHSFLCLLNLGIALELCDEFFNTMLNTCEIKLDNDLIQNDQWSRFCFTFEVLIKLIELMPKDNHYLRTCAMLSWLKENTTISTNTVNENDASIVNEREMELLTSKEFFMVKEYFLKEKVLSLLTLSQIEDINERYSQLTPAFDISYLIEMYVENSNVKLVCKICGKKMENILDFINTPCEVKLYHPRKLIILQRQIGSKCEHEDCKKRISIHEYPCCHKPAHYDGCLLSDGKHIIEYE